MKVLIQMVLWVALQVKDKKLLRGTSTTWPYISGRRFCELLNKTGSFMNSFKFFFPVMYVFRLGIHVCS
ncbi:hypothetical protein Hanom_Chr04g00374741 [Helianthus anomalus]